MKTLYRKHRDLFNRLFYAAVLFGAGVAGAVPPEVLQFAGLALALQYSVKLRTDKMAAIETSVGAAPILELRVGSPPADCVTVASGALLAQGALPSDWLAVAAAGAVAKTGTWQVTGLTAGNIGYFRIYEPGSPSACHMQGTVTATGGGGDMTVDNIAIAAAQVVTVNTFTLTAGNQ